MWYVWMTDVKQSRFNSQAMDDGQTCCVDFCRKDYLLQINSSKYGIIFNKIQCSETYVNIHFIIVN